MKTASYKCQVCGFRYKSLPIERGKETDAYCPDCGIWRVFKLVRGTTVDSVHKVFMPLHNSDFIVDTDFSEAQIRSNARHFFTNRRRGERETCTFHRGCVIVRRTVTFTDCRPQRLTTAFLFGKFAKGDGSFTFCIAHPASGDLKSIAQAKRLIDNILAANSYEHP